MHALNSKRHEQNDFASPFLYTVQRLGGGFVWFVDEFLQLCASLLTWKTLLVWVNHFRDPGHCSVLDVCSDLLPPAPCLRNYEILFVLASDWCCSLCPFRLVGSGDVDVRRDSSESRGEGEARCHRRHSEGRRPSSAPTDTAVSAAANPCADPYAQDSSAAAETVADTTSRGQEDVSDAAIDHR
jgi:hypothetical protein